MRIVLDECVPRRLGRDLTGHTVETVTRLGWNGIRNGELLKRLAAAGFEALITVDRGLSFQQNLQASGVSVILMSARRNSRDHLLPLVPALLAALSKVKPGEFLIIQNP